MCVIKRLTMVSVDYNEDLTPTDYIPNDYSNSHTFYIAKTDDCDDAFYEREYKIEENEWAKTGWNNPRKIGTPRKQVNKNIAIRVRNILPKKQNYP